MIRRTPDRIQPVGKASEWEAFVDDGRIPIMPTGTEKQRAIKALRTLPDDATIEDAIERLCFIAKIEQGIRESEAGRVVPHEEVKKLLLT